MKKFLLALFTVICTESYSQVIFEEGYFINESNKRVDCLIKNIDWKNNPNEFEYKFSQDGTVQKATIHTVKEFGVNNVSRYIRTKTNIDRSSDQIDGLNSEKNPQFQEELLFLKVLIEGHASLFLYVDGSLIRFFYKYNDSDITQLVYKRYLVDGEISKNDYYKQQLFLQLRCEGININDFKNLNYNRQDLERLLIKYHKCIGSNYINFESKQKKDLFNLNIRPGINFSSLKIHNSTSGSMDTDFDSKIGIRFGVETEFLLPFNRNKWSIIMEPAFQYYKSEKSKETDIVAGGILVLKVDYKSIQLPIGVRHYFFLNNKSKLFANISYVFDFPYSSSIKFLRKDGSEHSELEIKSRWNIAFGVGYKYMDRYNVELRYNTKREILGDYMLWSSNYNSLNIILGISFF